MKTLLFSIFILILGTLSLSAQEVTTFGGYHIQLYGYTDRRYVDQDQGDYLKTLAYYSGVEFVQRGFQTEDEFSQHVVLGGALIGYVQNAYDGKTLYAVSGNGRTIREESIPANSSDKTARFQAIGSAFGGYQAEWWGAEGGLSVFVKGQEEKVRRYYDKDGNVIDGAGRGWVFGDGSLILPNARLRIGLETLPHFVLSLYRGNFDPGYGAFQARVILPFPPSFGLQIGGSFYQTSSVFVEPSVILGGYSLSLRAGTILNYNDSAFTRVGIFEGAFLSGALGIHW